jgi:endonuclease YncB( thermonuclease family)
MVGQQEVRLFGIDAPELSQTCTRDGETWACGSAAANELSRLVAGKQVSCTSLGSDTHGRTLARCSVGPVELNRAMVALGYALAYRRYSFDYVSAEESAKAYRRGIWSGMFELPTDRLQKGPSSQVPVQNPNRPRAAESRATTRGRTS